MTFDHTAIDAKWQRIWQETGLYTVDMHSTKPKKYILDMFPYPSGQGLHVGHPLGYIGSDIYARFWRKKGYEVLHPMGWDAFGLPAENYAIKTGIHPRIVTEQNVANFKKQLSSMGFSFDWTKEVNTTDPAYYKWTQWIFLQLFHKGLAYESHLPINWCPSCKTGLANEEVTGGTCERCSTPVEQKPLRQWVLKITEYAERLLEDLKELNWPKSILDMQEHWIGKSIGTTFRLPVYTKDREPTDHEIRVFTTRVDTAFGMTFLSIAPEHELVAQITSAEATEAVEKYIDAAKKKSQLERTELAKEKTGVPTGAYAKNPFTGELIPVYVSDYVLGFYGTGAVMGVPAHDTRDWAFAEKYGLEIKTVIVTGHGEDHTDTQAFTDDGILVDSGEFSGLSSDEARRTMSSWLEQEGLGESTVNYKLRDWIFSRQRYWGEPIPVIHCAHCGVVGVPEDQLPVLLPDVEKYEPTGTGESPLAAIEDWVNTTCPTCHGPAKRETNTMPQWAGSCWYYLRYIDPTNTSALANNELLKAWLPVDMYVGGAEHAVLHLLYARFWHKVLYDCGVVPTKEPFYSLKNQGMILGPDNQKMSKSKGNVINPDETIAKVGADAFRTYEMFMGPFEATKPWNTASIEGVYRFLQKVWRLQTQVSADAAMDKKIITLMHQTIKKVTEDMESFNFNTCVSALMIYTNALAEGGHVSREAFGTLLNLLAPFAPHMTEELWETLGEKGSIHLAPWPEYDPLLTVADTMEIAVQVNGKLRGTITVQKDSSKEDIITLAKQEGGVAKYLDGQALKKEIYVPGKIVNLVI